MWTPFIKDKEEEALTKASEVDSHNTEAKADKKLTKEASEGIPTKIHKTILKPEPKTKKHLYLTEEATMGGKGANSSGQTRWCANCKKNHAQYSTMFRVTKRKRSTTLMKSKTNNPKTNKMNHCIVTQSNFSSKQKTKIWFLQSTGRESANNNFSRKQAQNNQ
jgi:hypothetical protein